MPSLHVGKLHRRGKCSSSLNGRPSQRSEMYSTSLVPQTLTQLMSALAAPHLPLNKRAVPQPPLPLNQHAFPHPPLPLPPSSSSSSLPQVRVAIIGLTAGGVGLDFSAAQTIVFAEVPRTAADFLQAEARAHRRGQRDPVTVVVFCAKVRRGGGKVE